MSKSRWSRFIELPWDKYKTCWGHGDISEVQTHFSLLLQLKGIDRLYIVLFVPKIEMCSKILL